MNINGIKVIIKGFDDMSEKEAAAYLAIARDECQGEFIKELTIRPAEDGKVNLDFAAKPPGFERIRRITGYLVGSTDRWNNAKRAEERDRVKHNCKTK